MEEVMEHIYNTENFQLKNAAVCLGKFDGIHKGHRLLIDTIKDYKKKQLQTVVFTFALHPSNLFSDTETELIDTMDEKIEKLESMGVDTLISFPFTEKTAAMEPEKFIKDILVEKVDAKVIVIGKDFRFGNHRKGNVELLKKLAPKYGYQVVDVEKITIDGQIVSSTRIRKEIKKGNMEKVTELLEMPYTITGEVLHGQQLGRTIGMPTINQAVAPHKIIPPKGVYVSKVYLEEGVHGGITNLGIKPTVSGEKQIGVETYIFDFDGNLYGKVLKTELLCFVRGEKKFPNLQSLKEQIYKDRKYGEEYIAQLRKNCLKNKI